jgi:hypothetical protein
MLEGKMMFTHTVESADPLVDVEDKLPLLPSQASDMAAEPATATVAPVPLGMRLAVNPAHEGKHGKTYTTVTETRDTERSDDGKVYTIPDTVRREEEID